MAIRRLVAGFVTVLCFSGVALADDWTDCGQQKSDFDRIIRGCSNIIRAGRESPTSLAIAYYDRALTYAKKGDHDLAVADFDKAIELRPRDARFYYGRGAFYSAGNAEGKANLDRAMADYDRAIALNPQFVEAYISRGIAHGNRFEFDREIVDETEAVRLKPDSGPAYYNRGIAYENQSEPAKALSDFRLAAQLIPASDPLHEEAASFVASIDRELAQAAPAVVAAAPTPQAAPEVVAPAGAGPQAASGRRVALVIGNSAYENVAQLTNPANDANLIADALKEDGFGVTVAINLDHDGLIKALRAFATEADDADWAVVYFAGHGIEMAGTNYLIPVDAKLLTDRDVEFEAVPIGHVMSAIDGAHVLRVLILDACRNNPFAATLKRTAGETRDVGRGLARIEPARGTEVIYSAKEGTIAADGDGADSPFATALAQHLTDPGVEVDKLFRLVRDDVLDATGNRQEPFVYGSLPGRQDFYFRPN
jgi:tetratricopeptide (TPR) repeat protein